MKIICKQEKLVHALNIVSKAISPSSTLGITRGILLKTEGDMQISLSATDIQIAITTETDAIVTEHGGIVVSARLFIDLIRKLPSGDILIAADEKNIVSIKTETSDYELQGIEEEEFPRIEGEEGGKKISLEKGLLKELIDGVCFAASADESRGIITGVLFEIQSGELAMVALDGYRVAIKREELPDISEDLKIVIPARMMRETGKILSEAEGDDEETVVLEIGEKRAKLYVEGTTVRMNLLEGDYIKYRDVVPKDNKISLRLNRKDLQSAVERASMFRTDGKNSFVRFSVAEKTLTVSSRADEGRAKETIFVEKEGEDVEIGFDAKFVSDVLKVIWEEEIRLEFNTSVSPCLIKPLEGQRFEYLILPVRLSTVNV